MARMSIACLNVCWSAVTTITECHLLQRVIPLTLIERSDDEPARWAAISLKSCWNTPGIACTRGESVA